MSKQVMKVSLTCSGNPCFFSHEVNSRIFTSSSESFDQFPKEASKARGLRLSLGWKILILRFGERRREGGGRRVCLCLILLLLGMSMEMAMDEREGDAIAMLVSLAARRSWRNG